MRYLSWILLALCPLAMAAEPAISARARLDAFAKGLNAVSGDFEQRAVDIGSGKAKTSRGTFSLKAPRQFRWETLSPYKQLVVADGEKVWVYDPDLEQVTVRAQGAEEARSPLTVLTDLSQLDSDFAASEQGEHDGQTWLRLKPKGEDPQFDYADLGFSGETLAGMIFQDTAGNRTEIRFSAWRRNAKLPADAFQFTPPKGVDIVGDPTPAAQTQPLRK